MNTPVKRNMEIVSNVEPGFIFTDEENREDAELIARNGAFRQKRCSSGR